MKKLLVLLIAINLFSCSHTDDSKEKNNLIGNFSSYTSTDTTATISIEQYQIELDFDDQADTIILKNLLELIDDPQIFNIVEIKLATGRNFIVKNIGGHKIDPKTIKQFPNRINSDKVYLPEFIKHKSYLIVWNYQYPDCDAEVTVLKLEQDNLSQIYKGNYFIEAIDDFNNDGKIDFKGMLTCDEDEAITIETLE